MNMLTEYCKMLFSLLILFVISGFIPTISSTLVIGSSCQGNGYIGESTNCQVYGQCSNGTISRLLRCPIGLYFDSAKQLCTANLPPKCPIDQLEDNEIELKTILTVNGTNELSSDPSSPPVNGYKVVCYFTNWAWTSSSYGSLYPEDIQPHLCTHINYAFAVLDNQTHTLISSNGTIDFNMNFYRRVTDLKQINPELKVLLSLGGWGDSADGLKYSQMVNNSTLRANFIKSVIPFLQSYGFDGLDLDWEYPTCWQNVCNYTQGLHDKQGFASLISELRSETNGSDFLITAAVGGWVNLVNTSYDVSSLAQSLDFVNLMTYDLYYDYYHVSVHHSQLFSITNSTSEYENSRNCDAVVNKWINEGFPANKLILGVPFYGRAFTLTDNITINSTDYGLNHKSVGPGLPGPVTKEPGYISFTEICRLIRDSDWTVKRFNGTEAPVAYKDNQWVGFDDLLSLKRKSDYIKQHGLGGAMLWELSLDDFQATCCSHTWPLLKTLNAELNGYPIDQNINCY